MRQTGYHSSTTVQFKVSRFVEFKVHAAACQSSRASVVRPSVSSARAPGKPVRRIFSRRPIAAAPPSQGENRGGKPIEKNINHAPLERRRPNETACLKTPESAPTPDAVVAAPASTYYRTPAPFFRKRATSAFQCALCDIAVPVTIAPCRRAEKKEKAQLHGRSRTKMHKIT